MALDGAIVTTVLFQRQDSTEEIPNMVSCYPNYKGLKIIKQNSVILLIRARIITTNKHIIMYHCIHVDSTQF